MQNELLDVKIVELPENERLQNPFLHRWPGLRKEFSSRRATSGNEYFWGCFFCSVQYPRIFWYLDTIRRPSEACGVVLGESVKGDPPQKFPEFARIFQKIPGFSRKFPNFPDCFLLSMERAGDGTATIHKSLKRENIKNREKPDKNPQDRF